MDVPLPKKIGKGTRKPFFSTGYLISRGLGIEKQGGLGKIILVLVRIYLSAHAFSWRARGGHPASPDESEPGAQRIAWVPSTPT